MFARETPRFLNQVRRPAAYSLFGSRGCDGRFRGYIEGELVAVCRSPSHGTSCVGITLDLECASCRSSGRLLRSGWREGRTTRITRHQRARSNCFHLTKVYALTTNLQGMVPPDAVLNNATFCSVGLR